MHPALQREQLRLAELLAVESVPSGLPYDSIEVPIERTVHLQRDLDVLKLGLITTATTSSNGLIGIGIGDTYFVIRDKRYTRVQPPTDVQEHVTASSFQHDNSMLILGYKSGSIAIYDVTASSISIHRVIRDAHNTAIVSVSILGGSRALSLAKDGSVLLHHWGLFGSDKLLLLNGNMQTTGQPKVLVNLPQLSRQGIDTCCLTAVVYERSVLIVKLVPTPGAVYKNFRLQDSPEGGFIDACWLRMGKEKIPCLIILRESSINVLSPSGGPENLSFNLVSACNLEISSHFQLCPLSAGVFAISAEHGNISIWQLNSELTPKPFATHQLPKSQGIFSILPFSDRDLIAVYANRVSSECVSCLKGEKIPCVCASPVVKLTLQSWEDFSRALVHQEKHREALTVLCGIFGKKIPGLIDTNDREHLQSLIRGVMISWVSKYGNLNSERMVCDLVEAAEISNQQEFFLQEISRFLQKELFWKILKNKTIEGKAILSAEIFKDILTWLKNSMHNEKFPGFELTKFILASPPEFVDPNFAIRFCAENNLEICSIALELKLLRDPVGPLRRLLLHSEKNRQHISDSQLNQETLFYFLWSVLNGGSEVFVSDQFLIDELDKEIFKSQGIFSRLNILNSQLFHAALPETRKYADLLTACTDSYSSWYFRFLAAVAVKTQGIFFNQDHIVRCVEALVDEKNSLLIDFLDLVHFSSAVPCAKVIALLGGKLETSRFFDFVRRHVHLGLLAELKKFHANDKIVEDVLVEGYLLFAAGDNHAAVDCLTRNFQVSKEWLELVAEFLKTKNAFTTEEKHHLINAAVTDSKALGIFLQEGVVLSQIPDSKKLILDQLIGTNFQVWEESFHEESEIYSSLKESLLADVGEKFCESVKSIKSGFQCSEEKCNICSLNFHQISDVACFTCGHVTHRQCLPNPITQCPTCAE